jgi:hypothetical protein
MAAWEGPLFSLSRPANWQVREVSPGRAWMLSPEAATRRTSDGWQNSTGMLAGLVQPPQAPPAKVIEVFVRDWVLGANPGMKMVRNEPGSVQVDGLPADSILFEGIADATGKPEMSWLVASLRPEGLFYLHFASPKDVAGTMGTMYWEVVQSVRFRPRAPSSSQAAPPARQAQPASTANWSRHDDPRAGFSASLPPGWVAETQPNATIVLKSADARAWAVVQPFMLQTAAAARDVAGQVPRSLATLLPGAAVTRVEQRGRRPDEAVAAVRYNSSSGPGEARLLVSIDGRTGMLYGIAAPQAEFAARRTELLAVLRSFRFTGDGGASAAGPARLSYVQWADPLEGAFSIEIPQGWQASGGMRRLAPVDTRASSEIRSPDGQILITTGDPQVPPFVLPAPTQAMAGLREGSWYSSPYGVKMMIRRYVPGVQFAAEYARNKYGQLCPGMKVVDSRDRQDLASLLGRGLKQMPGILMQQLTMGEISFTCSGPRPLIGYAFAGTQLNNASGTGLWTAPYLAGWLATPEAAPTAKAVLQHVATTIRMNPQWVGQQQHLTREQGEIVARAHAEISKSIDDTYWSRQRVMDDINRRRSNNTLGLTDVRDPQTGETWKVVSGHNYYWRKDYTDTVAGTNTHDRPDTDFSPLEEW